MTVRFDVEVSLALSADISADPSTWAWTDISSRCLVADGGVTIKRGRTDWQSTAQPASCQVMLNNSDGRFSRLNPSGTYYGQLNKNTPLRVRACVHGGSLTTRFVGFVSEWPVRWDPSESLFWVPVQADGVLRRLGRSTDLLRSAMFRRVIGVSGPLPTHYWPMEDPSGATEFSAATEDSPTLLVLAGTAEFAAVDPGTTANLPDTGTGSAKIGRFGLTGGTSGSWALEGAIKPASGGADFIALRADIASGTYNRVHVLLDNAPKIDIVATTSGGTAATVFTVAVDVFDNEFHLIEVRAAQTGANIEWSLILDGVLQGFADVAGTLGRLAGVVGNQDASTSCLSVGHIATYDSPAGLTVFARYAALGGWVGDTPGERFARLCNEEGVPNDLGTDSEQTMGPQLPSTLMDLLGECEAAAEGVLVDRIAGQLGLDTHVDRENQAVDLALDYDASHISPPFDPTDDDMLTKNSITAASPDNTATATVEDITGPLGIDTVGKYPESVTRNLEGNLGLADHAGWRLNLGTVNEYRYPVVNLKFHSSAMSSKLTSWLACDISSRVTIDNLPSNMPPDLVDQVIEGYTEQVDNYEWNVSANLSPFKPYAVGELTDTSGDTSEFAARYAEDAAAALRTAIDSDDTTVALDPNFWKWSTSVVYDTFTRTSSSSWGSPDVGDPTWTNTGGSASDFSVGSGVGKHSVGTVNVTRRSTLETFTLDQDITFHFVVPSAPTGVGSMFVILAARSVDTSNQYEVDCNVAVAAGTITFLIARRVGGVKTTIVAAGSSIAFVAGETYAVRVQVVSNVIRLKRWNVTSGSESNDWNVNFTDTTPLVAGTKFSLGTFFSAGITNALPVVITFDNLIINSGNGSPDDFPMDVRLVNAPGIAGGGEVVTATSLVTTAPVFLGNSAAVTIASSGNILVTVPAAATLDTDHLFLFATARNSGTGYPNTPDGWTRLEIFNATDNCQVFHRLKAGAADTTVTFTGGVANGTTMGRMSAFRGLSVTFDDANDLIIEAATQLNGSAADILMPGVYPFSWPNAVIIYFAWKQDDWTSASTPTEFTEAYESSTVTGDDASIVVGYWIQGAFTALAPPATLTIVGGASAISRVGVVALHGGVQFMAVTRGTNGVTKSHAVGTLLEVADPIVLAL